MVHGTEVNRACTFCRIARDLPAPEETFVHLFWDCPQTQKHINNYFELFFPEYNDKSEHEKKNLLVYRLWGGGGGDAQCQQDCASLLSLGSALQTQNCLMGNTKNKYRLRNNSDYKCVTSTQNCY